MGAGGTIWGSIMRIIVYPAWYWGLSVCGTYNVFSKGAVFIQRGFWVRRRLRIYLKYPGRPLGWRACGSSGVGLKEVDIRERTLLTMLKA